MYYIGKKQVDMFTTEGLSLNLSGSADGRDRRGISNIQTFCEKHALKFIHSLSEIESVVDCYNPIDFVDTRCFFPKPKKPEW